MSDVEVLQDHQNSQQVESEAEAVKLVAANPAEYLDSETVTRTEYKKPQPKTGEAIKDQLLYSNSKR